jgi:excisionase family DNA binding protein
MVHRLSMDEVCTVYGVSERTVLRWICFLGMPSYKIGGKRYFVQDELTQWEKKYQKNDNPDTDEDVEVCYHLTMASTENIFNLYCQRPLLCSSNMEGA